MEIDQNLTNETIKKRFGSQFELVGYLIKQARGMIRSGRGPTVRVATDNPAVIVVEEVLEGRDGAVYTQEALLRREEEAAAALLSMSSVTYEDFDDEEEEEEEKVEKSTAQ